MRSAYQLDIALCAKWILEINSQLNPSMVIEDILDNQTDKLLMDYFKGGELQ